MKIGVTKTLSIPVEKLELEGHEVYFLPDEISSNISHLSSIKLFFLMHQANVTALSETLKEIKNLIPDSYIIVLSQKPSLQDAITLIKQGADDFWVVPVEDEKFIKTVEWVEKKFFTPLETQEERPIISVSQKMLTLKKIAKQIAPTDATVFIQGESGTGKELFARYIHQHSRRSKGPFVAVNCAAIPENLLESELFGYEKGAFTGATRQKPGKFELGQGGTILLDEITEIPLHLQTKLLRVIQEKEVERLGGIKPIPLNVRILATTNVNVEEKVKEGSFRKDLYYRLNVIPLKIPPLRERPEDIIPIAEFLLKKLSKEQKVPLKELSQEAKLKLKSYFWPGNVRELENVIQRAFFLSPMRQISSESIIFDSLEEEASAREEFSQIMPIREMEKRLIFKALEASDGNRTKAAEILGITVRTLRNKLKEYKMQIKE